jgi:AbiV family abortive infection protein
MAVLAHEEAAKDKIIGYLGLCALQGRSLRRAWREYFESHGHKTRVTIEAVRMIQARAEGPDDKVFADGLVTARERATYVDCVQGPERWATPDALVDRGGALDILRAARQAFIGPLAPALVVRAFAAAQARDAGETPTTRAWRDWSETAEARELSDLAASEARDFVAEVDAIFARLV